MGYLETLQRMNPAVIYPGGISLTEAPKDYSTNGRNGTIVGTNPTFPNNAPVGMGSKYKAGNYAGGLVQSPASASWMDATTGGVVCWGKQASTSGIHVLSERRDRNWYILWNRDDSGAASGVNHAMQGIVYCGANSIIIDTAEANNDNLWHLWALTWDWNGSNLTTARIYKDAVQKAIGTTTTAPAPGSGSAFTNERIVFGSEYDQTRNWNGDLMWGAFFNTQITQAMLQELYVAGLRDGVVY